MLSNSGAQPNSRLRPPEFISRWQELGEEAKKNLRLLMVAATAKMSAMTRPNAITRIEFSTTQIEELLHSSALDKDLFVTTVLKALRPLGIEFSANLSKVIIPTQTFMSYIVLAAQDKKEGGQYGALLAQVYPDDSKRSQF